MLEAGLGLRVGLTPPLDVTVGRGGRVEYVEIDPIRCFVVRVSDDSVHELVVRGGEYCTIDLPRSFYYRSVEYRVPRRSLFSTTTTKVEYQPSKRQTSTTSAHRQRG